MSGPIIVLAGVNGAGKSSVAGEFLRASGGDFVNPDTLAADLRAANPHLTLEQSNALAWQLNLKGLRAAIDARTPYAFETTLGGRTISAELERAARADIDVCIWYVGLDSVERHLARIRRRVATGGHTIPDTKVRERYETSRANLIRLLPLLSELMLFDNSQDTRGRHAPTLTPLARHRRGRPLVCGDLTVTPAWAKSIVAAMLRVADPIQ